MEKFWSPRPEVIAYAESLIQTGSSVLEIGPGFVPFSKATCFVERIAWRPLPGPCISINVIRDPLPFADKSFDFVYCRHVVEDLAYPDLLLSEMCRVGKAGYIETPSPVAELTRGVDGSSPPYRGYVHHRWIVWVSEDKLCLVEKGNVIEQLDFSDIENALPPPSTIPSCGTRIYSGKETSSSNGWSTPSISICIRTTKSSFSARTKRAGRTPPRQLRESTVLDKSRSRVACAQ